jgi:hypothetical protein
MVGVEDKDPASIRPILRAFYPSLDVCSGYDCSRRLLVVYRQ